ncbi:Uncharacterised protein [Brucella neotomae]|nr:Uncharacterised protein [Brucella neotomae]
MFRRGEELFRHTGFDHFTGAHDIDPVGEAAHDAQIMRDENHRHSEPLLQICQKVQNLRLNGDVQRCGRLIRDQDIRLVGKRHGNHDALALPTGKLIRVAVDAPFRFGNADQFQEFQNARAGILLAEAAMIAKRLGQLIANPV